MKRSRWSNLVATIGLRTAKSDYSIQPLDNAGNKGVQISRLLQVSTSNKESDI